VQNHSYYNIFKAKKEWKTCELFRNKRIFFHSYSHSLSGFKDPFQMKEKDIHIPSQDIDNISTTLYR